jgi:hypothetical protein
MVPNIAPRKLDGSHISDENAPIPDITHQKYGALIQKNAQNSTKMAWWTQFFLSIASGSLKELSYLSNLGEPRLQ